MALTSYTGLKNAIAGALRRTDLGDTIPDFITLTEAQTNRRLRDAKVVAVASATLSDEYSAVPDDFAGVVDFTLDTSPPTQLDGFAAHELAERIATCWSAAGRPRAYAVVGDAFRFAPAPDGSYTGLLTYYVKVPALSDAASSNWLLEKHPDVYFYGALLQAAPYLRDNDGRLASWSAFYEAAINDIITQAERDRFGARPARRMRSFG